MNQVRFQKAQQFLADKGATARCPYCGNDKFAIIEEGTMNFSQTAEQVSENSQPATLPGTVNYITSGLPIMNSVTYTSGVPVVAVGCHNCGYLMFFSAKKMGL